MKHTLKSRDEKLGTWVFDEEGLHTKDDLISYTIMSKATANSSLLGASGKLTIRLVDDATYLALPVAAGDFSTAERIASWLTMKKIRLLKPVDGALRQHCRDCDATNDLKPREHGSALLTCASCGSNHVEFLNAQAYATWLADHRGIQE